VQDLLDAKIFRQKLDVVLQEKNLILTKIYNRPAIPAASIAEKYLDEFAPRLAPMIGDTVAIVHDALDRGERSSSREPRQRSSTWITEPIRS